MHGGIEVPFDIARVFYLYDIPAGAHRGGHAHRVLEEVIVAVMGSISVAVDDGRERRTVDLRQPNVGLYIPPMLWAELVDFASGSIAVVLASAPFDEADYVRDHAEYVRLVSAGLLVVLVDDASAAELHLVAVQPRKQSAPVGRPG